MINELAAAQGKVVKVAFRINGQLVPLHSHMDTELAMLMVLYADDMVLLADSRGGLITALGVWHIGKAGMVKDITNYTVWVVQQVLKVISGDLF